MNDSVRETFEQDYEELHGIAVPESSFKRDETGNYYDPDIAREWIIWSAAWRANGGEAERLRQELADMKRVFNTAMEAAEFPDAHPAPPSVAVPEGWKLVPVEPTTEMLGEGAIALFAQSREPLSSAYRSMLAAAPRCPMLTAAHSPAQSVEEIQAGALDRHAAEMRRAAQEIRDDQERMSRTESVFLGYSADKAEAEAARLRQSGNAGDDGEEESHA